MKSKNQITMKRIDENHSFNINVCQVLKGHIQKAILLKEIYGWCLINNSKKHNIKFGLPWTYMSSAGFALKFPYMGGKEDKKGNRSPRSITRWLKELEQDGWLYSSNFNKKAYDRTKWFTINFERYDLAVLSSIQPIGQIDQWIGQISQCIRQIDQCIGQDGQPIPSPSTTTSSTPSTFTVCIKEKDTQIQNLKIELSLLKKEKEKKRKKLAAKKERSPVDKRDKRKNKQLPFDIVSARKTVDTIFPTWKELDKQYKEVFNDPASEEVYKKCLKTFVETGIASYYTSIRTIDKLIVKLLEWTRQEFEWNAKQKIKNYESNKPSRSSNRRNGAVSQEFSDNIENSLKAFYAQTLGEG